MNFLKPTIILLLPLFFIHTHAIVFNITNNCPYTVWAASVPGGGRRLDNGQSWTLNFPDGPRLARIWARTNCTFNAAGNGTCLTGDCDGQLECQSYGAPPHTVARYGLNNFGHRDYYDISVLEGFNVPIEFAPTTNGCTRPVSTVYQTTQYCCHSGPCRPTELSRFFKSRCRDAFTYPQDDPTSTFICPEGTSYRVVFCP
ncbi:protein p21 [Phtheirospermum japonicum]|uniref:Protein p21 n=1 Tax=Phtheirospermum japonicum TaxID=374723 RepID=A0A830BJ85_9LAMI|nr:protein p21 [Phtheirospermum japonicum]